jgi:hypothetical protein
LRQLQQAMLMIERTQPMIGPKPPPPEPPSDDEWTDMYVKAAIYGSEELMEAFNTFSSKAREFQAYAFTWERVRDHPSETGETGVKMEQSRGEAARALNEIERRMRKELAEL